LGGRVFWGKCSCSPSVQYFEINGLTVWYGVQAPMTGESYHDNLYYTGPQPPITSTNFKPQPAQWTCNMREGTSPDFQRKLLGGSMIFQVTTSPMETKNLTAWHLMPHNKHLSKEGCKCLFCNHKIFNPCKHRMVTIQPLDLFMFSAQVNHVHCQLSAIVYQHIRLLFIRFWSVVFNLLCSTIQCLITQLFSVIFSSDTGIEFQVFQSH
jgi:hypothetical protein